MNKKHSETPILIEDYNYPLPDERIAKYPLEKRDASKLLLYRNGEIREDLFVNAASYLPEASLLIYNNTRVIQARIVFHKSTGARIEIFCLEPLSPSDYALSLGSQSGCSWVCLVGNLKKWKSGELEKQVQIGTKKICLKAEKTGSADKDHQIQFSWDDNSISFAEILEAAGELPIPPYLNRDTEEQDKTSYQTIYSRIQGSVAAPTAGLHFTDSVFESLKSKNITTDELTLHVGAGTFQPVKSEIIADHEMHTEVISVRIETIRNILGHIGKIIAVGTTSVRTLESLYYLGLQTHKNPGVSPGNLEVKQWEPYQQTEYLSVDTSLNSLLKYMEAHQLTILHSRTQILIQPGFIYRVISGMFTNFHQPKSTLLLLVSAFAGEDWHKIYAYALSHNFRFLSYGDSSLLIK